MPELVWVMAGGALGAIARYGLDRWVAGRLGSAFPYGTFVINVTGCLVIGILGALALQRSPLAPGPVRLFLGVGFLGAYTTFSTFGLDTVLLIENGRAGVAGLYVLASVTAGLAAVILGMAIGRSLP